jgi:hypothetical protein
MLRGLPHLTKYMPEPKNSHRLIPDPDNEPDFYAISSKHPLPDDPYFDMAKPEETSKKPPENEPLATPRLVSETSWFNDQMPPAKRSSLESNMYNVAAAASAQVSTAPSPLVSYADNVPGLVAAASRGKANTQPMMPSEGSWFNGQHVLANPSALTFKDDDVTVTSLLAAATAAMVHKVPTPLAACSIPLVAPRLYGDATSILSQLQDVINENNKFLLVAALQAGLLGSGGGFSQLRAHQQAPLFDQKSIDAQTIALASMLRSQTTSFGVQIGENLNGR